MNNMNNMYDLFETDQSAEQSGIILDYDNFRVTVGRAGGANKRFKKNLKNAIKPFQRIIANDQLSDDKADRILHKSFAESNVFNWEIKTIEYEDKDIGQGHTEQEEIEVWKQGIHAKDGTILDFTIENLLLTFNALPELFTDIHQRASDASNFRRQVQEDEAKN